MTQNIAPDFKSARQFMIDGQLRANGIVDTGVLHGFATTPREFFVPPAFGRAAYVDETIVFPDGFLPEPLVAARLLQAAGLRLEDSALVVGDATGNVAALLAPLVTSVTLAGKVNGTAAMAIMAAGCQNVQLVASETPQGPFTVIIAGGAVAEIPDAWLACLAPRGRLLTVLRPPRKAGTIVLVEKDANGVFGRRALHDAELPYITGHAPQPAFLF